MDTDVRAKLEAEAEAGIAGNTKLHQKAINGVGLPLLNAVSEVT